jgi:penicillin-binding protein 2
MSGENLEPQEKGPGRRIATLRFLFILIFLAYGVRLFSLQILSGDLYRSRAKDIARRTAVIPAQRGEIYDRNFNQPLVLNDD